MIHFTRTATAISKPELPDVAMPDAYKLSGQKLTAPKKGINIIGGKKVVIKWVINNHENGPRDFRSVNR